ncbi:MAG: hypothetical protein HZB55_11320 [Deltaproteobacteria bacterium]|nr:hypothetical protein [Deltaproteobacteria bacterium]
MDDRIVRDAGAGRRSQAVEVLVTLVCACAGPRPGGGPERQYSLAERSIRQPLDHGVPTGPQLDQQVHVLVPDGCSPSAPVFFILGGEVDATPERLAQTWRAYGRPRDVIFVQAEHRGYGQSVSADEDQTVPSYVRIDQTLADDHRVAQVLRREFSGPWMVAG